MPLFDPRVFDGPRVFDVGLVVTFDPDRLVRVEFETRVVPVRYEERHDPQAVPSVAVVAFENRETAVLFECRACTVPFADPEDDLPESRVVMVLAENRVADCDAVASVVVRSEERESGVAESRRMGVDDGDR